MRPGGARQGAMRVVAHASYPALNRGAAGVSNATDDDESEIDELGHR